MRTLTIVFVSLVALPASVLGWLGFQSVDRLEADARRVIERETRIGFEKSLERLRQEADQANRYFDDRVAREAAAWARRLPMDDDPAAWVDATGSIVSRFGELAVRFRVDVATGEPLLPRSEFPELPEWERFEKIRADALRRIAQPGLAVPALRMAAARLQSPRLRERLNRIADAILPLAQRPPDVDPPRPVASAALPHGAHLTMLVQSLSRPSMADDLDGIRTIRTEVSREAKAPTRRGLGWCESVEGPVTRAGCYFRVRVEHPRASSFVAQVRRRKSLTVGAIGALLALMVVGLWLARRALLRERAARQLRDAFIANVSHELKTPLTSVRMYAEMLADGAIESSKREEYGRVVDAEGARLAALVDDMLDFSALERGARELEIEPTDVARLVRATVEAWRPLAEREGVELDVDGPREGVVALADSSAVGRIVTNLLQNALKHGAQPRHGEQRRIRVCIDGVLAVCDNGQGVPEAEREVVFDRFRRGTSAGNKAGAGIGLALSRELARSMNGELMVEDDGTWTRFLLRLPPVPIEPA